MLVQLKVKDSKDVREFEKAHAIKLLRIKNSMFELPSDSKFEFIDNELKRRKNKRADQKQPRKA